MNGGSEGRVKIEPLETEEDAVTIQRTQRVRKREAWVGWTTVAANILVPFTIALAAYGLLQDSWAKRSDAAQRQIELFYSQGLGEAKGQLFALWNDVDLTVLQTVQTRSFTDAFVERAIVASGAERRQITSAIVNLASYFDRVEACIASGRCDGAEISNQLGQYGRDFFCLYAGQIKALREDSLILRLGAGLEEFAERQGGCSASGSRSG